MIDDTSRTLDELRADPSSIQCDNPKHAPTAFEVILIQDSAARFAGSRTFVEDVETVTKDFYDLVGQHLKKWQPSAPKPIIRPAQEDALGLCEAGELEAELE